MKFSNVLGVDEAQIAPFQHPNEFMISNGPNEGQWRHLLAERNLFISLYKSCEELKAKCLNLECRIGELEKKNENDSRRA
jgi:hypothetical protein